VAFSASDTWGQLVKDGVQKQELTVIPYELLLDYDYWNYRTDGPYSSHDPVHLSLTPYIGDVMFSILPEELHDDVPAGFNVAGHVGMLPLSSIPSGRVP
jgi:tRNA (guanine37-N1)-methyltransferase